MKKTLLLLLCFACIGSDIMAQKRQHKHKDPISKSVSDTTKEMGSSFEKLTKGAKIQTGFISSFKKGKSYYIILHDSVLGRDVLMGARLAEISQSTNISAGQMRFNPILIRFRKHGSYIAMEKQVSQNLVDRTDPIAPAVDRNNVTPILRLFDISASEGGHHIIEVTKYFAEEVSEVPLNLDLKGRQEGRLGGIEDIRSFARNTEVSCRYYYVGGKEPAMAAIRYSWLLLSKEAMRPRLADDRINYITVNKRRFEANQEVSRERYISRFRLDLNTEQEAAYRRGESVQMNTPIIMWVDPAMPSKWHSYVFQGIEDWNKAFEAIGLTNVIQARLFPSNDPRWSPLDITNNCLHYIAVSDENAAGPCWTDPRSGEIIQSDILWFHNVIKLLQRWYFIQTAAANPIARERTLPDSIMGELIRYAVSHEMGHCLGMNHNMRASFAYPVDSLRSPSFTQKYGTAASIMDYARNNHIAQPGDDLRGVRMTPANLGPYDYFAIQYAYQPIFDAASPKAEWDDLNKLLVSKENNPIYIHGPKISAAIPHDPASQSDALGNDLTYAASLAIPNILYILDHLLEWRVEEGEDYVVLRESYEALQKAFFKHLNATLSYIGGYHVFYGGSDHHQVKYLGIPKRKQKETLQFIFNQLHQNYGRFQRTDILSLTGYSDLLHKQPSEMIEHLVNINTLNRLIQSRAYSHEPYELSEYFDDLNQALFKVAHQPLNDAFRIMQGVYVERMLSLSQAELKTPTDALFSSEAFKALEKTKAMLRQLSQSGPNKMHYQFLLHKLS